MRALVKTDSAPGISMADVPVPEIGPNDILVRITRSAICGTDMHIYNWDEWAARTIPIPMVIGHEFCGRIVEIGSEVRGLSVGDRVSAEGHITCGFCRNCRAGRRHLCINASGIGINQQGAFAEYLSVPAGNAFLLPDSIDDETAAILDPLGNATHTALSFDLVGEDVLITGAGPIGIMATAIARHAGARHIVVTDVNGYRLDLAQRMGASRVVNVAHQSIDDTMEALGMQEGFDVGMEMSGAPSAIAEMFRTVHHGARIALLGIQPAGTAIDWEAIIFKGLMIKGVYGREMFETWYKMASMLQSGLDISPIITHRYRIDDYLDGFDAMGSGNSGKVILDWGEAD
jgi:threonine 3-dehydrogenase